MHFSRIQDPHEVPELNEEALRQMEQNRLLALERRRQRLTQGDTTASTSSTFLGRDDAVASTSSNAVGNGDSVTPPPRNGSRADPDDADENVLQAEPVPSGNREGKEIVAKEAQITASPRSSAPAQGSPSRGWFNNCDSD